ncbi:MAG: hypothetical protein JNK02_05990 [Planctomycetes bacterium]|nr:hypothetical protein [Planctomycetota bacterium]
MQRTHALLALALLAPALGFVASACTREAGPGPVKPKPAVVKAEPTDEAALARSRIYWANAEKKDWIPNYDLLGPELRGQQSPTMFLQGKTNHIYEGMRAQEVVARKDDLIFLRVTGRWTPNLPQIKNVRLEPGQTLTQDIEIIEVWRWMRDAWFLERPLRPDEFLEQFPDLQPNAAPKTAAGESGAGAGAPR